MEIVVADGLVMRRPGVGTWPLRAEAGKRQGDSKAAPVSRQKAHLTGLLENIVNMGLRTTVEVIDSTVVLASDAIAEALHLAVGDPVYKSVRVRRTSAGPGTSTPSYVPQAGSE